MQGVRCLRYQIENEISSEVAAGAMWHLNLSMDQVSLVVKATLCLILAEQEPLNVSTVKAVVTLDLWAGDDKFFIF